jgi:D-aminoacyl-tRNA deacylase
VRVLLQRVLEAKVEVEGESVGAIGHGLLLLVGIGPDDDEAALAWMARKCAALRVFSDAGGKMDASVVDVGGSCLAVSQFTLYGDVKKGNRPSFIGAAEPEDATRLFDRFCELLSAHVPVQTGRFGADMQVSLTNDGPVTIWLER